MAYVSYEIAENAKKAIKEYDGILIIYESTTN